MPTKIGPCLLECLRCLLKNWRILRKIRSSPSTADTLIAAVQTLMIAHA
jgi:hypothetical protein